MKNIRDMFSVYVLTKQLDDSDSDIKKVWMQLIKLEKVIHSQVMIFFFFLCIFILQFSVFLSVIFLSVSSQNPIFSEINAIHQFLSQTQTFRGQQGQEGIYQRHIRTL